MYRVLICGLPGSGKTTIAQKLQPKLNAAWFNADEVRASFNDWRFDKVGRTRQARRMRALCDMAAEDRKAVAICDFVAPTTSLREAFAPHFTVHIDTIVAGRYADTNRLFDPPAAPDYVVRPMHVNETDRTVEDIARAVVASRGR